MNILLFSLKTAEQSLAEVQPHVVVKLQEGRSRRLQLLETTARENRKDINQRSMETCTFSSTHLADFEVKAATKSKVAEDGWLQVLERLKKIMSPTTLRTKVENVSSYAGEQRERGTTLDETKEKNV